ncbi:MAG: cysteine-rich CWC family protein [Bacteroidota bacterium]|nr:cysteine-rich CWC family protein [Bacteroidota bacterium]
MCKHKEKNCPRCHAKFECKVGDIAHCQCYGIQLTVEEEAFVASQYDECLCRNCLLQLKQRYPIFLEQKVFYANR